MRIKAVLFDLDGVLVDTKAVHFDALNLALEEHGFPAISRAEHLRHYDGLKTAQKLDRLTRDKRVPAEAHAGIWARKQELTSRALGNGSNGGSGEAVRAVLADLRRDGVLLGCCTNSIRQTVDAALDGLGASAAFDVVLASEDVSHGKPHPELYWKAMATLSVLPEETLVVEDSPVGLAAACRSGAHVLRVACPKDVTAACIRQKMDEVWAKPAHQPRWQHPRLNVLIPMAGAGSRFEKAGYALPKPLIDVHGKPMIQVVVENLGMDARFIFVVQKAHRAAHHLDGLLQRIAPGCIVVEADGLTEGAACTALLAEAHIDNDAPLFFANSDQFVEWQAADFMYKMQETGVDGGIVIFPASDPKWSYAKVAEDGVVTEVAEKRPISEHATAGYYYWKHGADFVRYAKRMIQRDTRVNNEFYVCPVFNEAIEDGKVLTVFPVDGMWGLGTPEDLHVFLRDYRPRLPIRLIAHRGNLAGPDPSRENSPSHVQAALARGFDVEIDLWVTDDGALRLGHDEPQHPVEASFLHKPGLWIHCKNVAALEHCKNAALTAPYFWHQDDDVALTSTGHLWTYPGKPLTQHSIAVMPETRPFRHLGKAWGVCSDYVADVPRLAEWMAAAADTPRVALYISGRVRGYESQLARLLAFQEAHNIDVFCSINAELDDYHTAFLEALRVKRFHAQPYRFEDEKWAQTPCPYGNAYNMSSMFFNNMKAFEMIEAYQRERGFVYDVVIKFRADVVSSDLMWIDPDLAPGTLYIPEGCDYDSTGMGAINDQLAYGDVQAMRVYSSVYAPMGEYLEHGVPFHPETLLHLHLKVHGANVRRFPFDYHLHNDRFRD
jgi:HAD superfamily hydrolase (TIGR01509 family)